MTKERFNDLWEYCPNQREEEVWGFINGILNQKNIRNVLEIGIEQGGSGNLWNDFCVKNNGFYIGVDLDISIGRKNYDREYGGLLKRYLVEGNSSNLKIVSEVKKLIDTKGKADFLFVDLNDGYKDNYLGIVNYYPFLRSGGVLAIHDVLIPPVGNAVTEAKSKVIKYSSEGLFTCDYSREVNTMGIKYFIKE